MSDDWKNFEPRRNAPVAATQPKDSAAPVDIDLLDTLLEMDRKALKTLLQRVLQAGWGYGKLTGKELLEHALKSKDEAYEALKLTALTLATNAKEWREFTALATFWSEREKGKPTQAVDITGKIGIVEIVLEASRQRNVGTIVGTSSTMIIDNNDKSIA